ncbi:MAG TPA: ECF-type sigma factor [Bryobacteraceae bacterium]|jgi:RNA polymerase sigma factor (TIGR02999 family)|nr:ECF-type sigma factor [Bryobacteraceae bacterium]
MRLENFQREDLDYLFSVTYEELKRLASSIRAGSATLNPTALVNEAWIKLSRSPKFSAASPLHFKRIAARAMRQVLVDAARRRASEKRAGGAEFVVFDEATDIAAGERDLLGLDTALDELAKVAPRQAMIVEGRFFGGLEIQEIAELMRLSPATIVRDWRSARAWLALKVRG